MALILTAALLILNFASSENTVNRTVRWNTFESINNGDWSIEYYGGRSRVFVRPSALHENLRPLDTNFSGNVWGSNTQIDCDYIYPRSSMPDLGELADVTLKMRYYLPRANYYVGIAAYPVEGDDPLFILPNSPTVEWTEVSLRINLTLLQDESIWIVHVMDPGDVVLFDEISLTFTEGSKHPQFSCNGRPDGVYRRHGTKDSFWKCEAGQATIQYCPEYSVFNPLRRECHDMGNVN